jgi:hypothetical protein
VARYRKIDTDLNMPTQKLTPAIITAAIDGFESQKRGIDEQIAELRTMLPGNAIETAATPESAPKKRRKMSAAVRRKMALAQKTRWAKIRGEVEPPAPAQAEAAKPKRKISPEGMKRIIAATKKRWAAKRAESAKPQKKAATKRAPVKRSAAKTAQAAAPAAT